jgi:hypothetical protein
MLLSAALCVLLLATVAQSSHQHNHHHHPSPPTLPVDDLGLHEVDLESAPAVAAMYSRWQRKHGRETSSTKQHAAELANFHASARRVKQHLKDHAAGLTNTVLELNKFAHMSWTDFSQRRLGRHHDHQPVAAASTEHSSRHQAPSKAASDPAPLTSGWGSWFDWGSWAASPTVAPPTVATSTVAPSKVASTTVAPSRVVPPAVVPPSVVPPSAAPTSKNWTQEGYVTPVKDQGNCGCCWAFGSTGALEGAYKKAKNKLLSFSEQELIECVKQWAGCGGGIEGDAFNLVKKNKGINLESTYPYTAMNSKYSKTCATGLAATRVSMNVAWSDIPKGDESLMKAIQTDGPIALSIALGDRFQYYSRGVMQPAQYCTKLNNHAVLLVGYGTDPVTKEDYWLVKNSWGTDWGEQGYFRMTRAVRNACGISNEAYRVIVS